VTIEEREGETTFEQVSWGSSEHNPLVVRPRGKWYECYANPPEQGTTDPLIPPQRTSLPLWLALLLKRQRRANIVPPPWLLPRSLEETLDLETSHFPDSFSPPPPLPTPKRSRYDSRPFLPSPPFLPSSTSTASPDALPYHWLELGQMLLDSAADDLVEPDRVRQLLRDLREVRAFKVRKGIEVLKGEGDGVRLDGVGAMEIGECRGFIAGVVDGLRKIGASREQARKEREAEEREDGYGGENEEEDMEY
jgi:GINS complex subunit 2